MKERTPLLHYNYMYFNCVLPGAFEKGKKLFVEGRFSIFYLSLLKNLLSNFLYKYIFDKNLSVL